MPTVKDKITGKVISEQRYNQEGIQNAATIAESNPNWEIDYAPGGEYNAPDIRENYQLGGLVPGQEGFGQKPILPQKPISLSEWPEPGPGDKFHTDMYKKGGKVKYKKGGKVK